jgi:hypothetical protein
MMGQQALSFHHQGGDGLVKNEPKQRCFAGSANKSTITYT